MERIWVHRPQDLAGIDVLAGEDCGRHWQVFHETYTVSTILRGCGEWAYRRGRHRMDTGDLCLMEPGETHVTTELGGTGDFRVLLLPAPILIPALEEMGAAGVPHLRHARVGSAAAFRRFARLARSIERPASALERQARFQECLALLAGWMERRSREARETGGHEAARRAAALLRERFADNLSLEDLSRHAGLSRFHLLRVFKHRIGMTPHAYQTRVRCARARALLREGMPPALVAGATGFADQSHLTRQFKRAWGVTPGAYFLADRARKAIPF